MENIKNFKLEKVLQSDVSTKHTVLLGNLNGEPCLLKLSRLALPESEFKIGMNLPIKESSLLDKNGIYSWGTGSLLEKSSCYFDIVYPATEKHIAKYTVAPQHVITETPQMYTDVVSKYIETQRGSRIDWVRGILHEGVEADKVFFRNDDFVLLPNSKWDQKTVEALYLLVLVTRDDLASIRDLTNQHIPFLENIKQQVYKVVYERWGLDSSKLKIYLHYQPSYYHLHLHVVNVEMEMQDFGRSLFLDNVIDMLQVRPMREATLTYILSESHDLYDKLK